MKVSIISNFHENTPVSRSEILRKYFATKGYKYELLYSSFSHSLKKFRFFEGNQMKPIETISYTSNISLKRFISHLIFMFKVFFHLKKNKPDLIYIILPPNILSLIGIFFKKKSTKLIIDIIDIWPEAFPAKNLFIKSIIFVPGLFSKLIRKIVIELSDYCITESNFFYKKLNLKLKINSSVIHLKKFQKIKSKNSQITESFSIAYLGNIGNIYDFNSLFTILQRVGKSRLCHLHIIGDGPRKKWFFSNLKKMNIHFTYHGASYDENFKFEILSSCWFGYNGYLDKTEVALSYKSIDYLSFGLPLINSAKHDSEKLVNKYHIGYNFSENNLEHLIEKLIIIERNDVDSLKKNALKAFEELFSGNSLFNDMDNILEKVKQID